MKMVSYYASVGYLKMQKFMNSFPVTTFSLLLLSCELPAIIKTFLLSQGKKIS